MLLLKIAITQFVLPPGILILILLLAGSYMLVRQSGRRAGLMLVCCSALLWITSTSLFSDMLLRQIEKGLSFSGPLRGDAIVLLGGGLNPEALDLSGTGVPSAQMMSRIVTAVRVQRHTGLPVIVSGGTVFTPKYPEAVVVGRILQDLGIAPDKIIVEPESRDTLENARFSKRICDRMHFRKVLLVTSAYHMKRALFLFGRSGLQAVPVPADMSSGPAWRITWQHVLPRASALEDTAKTVREYIGLAYYMMVLGSGP